MGDRRQQGQILLDELSEFACVELSPTTTIFNFCDSTLASLEKLVAGDFEKGSIMGMKVRVCDPDLRDGLLAWLHEFRKWDDETILNFKIYKALNELTASPRAAFRQRAKAKPDPREVIANRRRHNRHG